MKKKEIKKLVLTVKNENTSAKDGKPTKEALYKVSLAKTGGQKCCTVVRDCQLRPFDYAMELKSDEFEEEKTSLQEEQVPESIS